MSMAKEENFENAFEAASDFNNILQFFGLGIYLDATTGKNKVKLCRRIGFALRISWALVAIVIVLSETEYQRSEIVSTIVDMGWHYQYQLEAILVLVTLIFNYAKRKHSQTFLAKLSEFVETSTSMAWFQTKPSSSRFCRYIPSGVVVISILQLVLFQLYLMRFSHGLKIEILGSVRSFVFLYISEFFFLVSFQFVLGTWTVYTRFSALNMNVR
jgi:hypothetical protein